MKLSDIKINPNNPRKISDTKLQKLVQSIKKFPKMLELRPIIVNKDNVILGGNMRYRALQELGYTEISDNWIKVADELTDEEARRFIIEDNVSFGTWDYEMLSVDFEVQELDDWGLEIDSFNIEGIEDRDFNNKEVNIDELGEMAELKIKLDYETYMRVLERFSEIAEDTTTAFMTMFEAYV